MLLFFIVIEQVTNNLIPDLVPYLCLALTACALCLAPTARALHAVPLRLRSRVRMIFHWSASVESAPEQVLLILPHRKLLIHLHYSS